MLLSSDFYYFTGSLTAPFRLEKSSFPFSFQVSESTTLPPNIEMKYNATVYLKKITATYRTRFVAIDDPFDFQEIEGKWTGIFLHTINAKEEAREMN